MQKLYVSWDLFNKFTDCRRTYLCLVVRLDNLLPKRAFSIKKIKELVHKITLPILLQNDIVKHPFRRKLFSN